MAKVTRCAVYTRKSTEEGLDQAFNSLHAQREACEAYILSQRHEGWQAIATEYDDGGYSGGTMDRPALRRLLADIAAGRIDVVVVYKVDRLTRALSDFARIVETFDGQGVSFVSVTQQFNTTTSMGRLTLNVLLSFAQFEREVTGERIRDKIAASKKKGMWMGGTVPLGYDAVDRQLVVNNEEARTIKTLFRLYRELGSVREVKREADRLGLRSKRRETKAGQPSGGVPLTPGYIYHLLANPLYGGRIRHRDAVYEGNHEAIVDPEEWEAVQRQLDANRNGHRDRVRASEPSLLSGLLLDENGERLTPSHASKGGVRYRYYVSQALIEKAASEVRTAWRLPAGEVEALMLRALRDLLSDRKQMMGLVSDGQAAPERIKLVLARAAYHAAVCGSAAEAAGQRVLVRKIVERVKVHRDRVEIAWRPAALIGLLTDADESEPAGWTETLVVPVTLKERGVETRLVIGDGSGRGAKPDRTLIKAIARGHLWFEQLATGEAPSINAIARREGVTGRYVSRLLDLAFLAPEVVEAVMEGRQPVDLTAERITQEVELPMAWEQQVKALGL